MSADPATTRESAGIPPLLQEPAPDTRGDDSAPYRLGTGARVALIGNTLAERMQYDGWLEANLQLLHCDRSVVFRDFGFSGDEIDLRIRSKGFGSPDQHLTRFGADVVLMMFGYGESFAGPGGVEAFRAKYVAEIRRLQGLKFNGRSAPVLVLVTPPDCEDLGDPNLPDVEATNQRLDLYARAIRSAAAETGCPCVDLFGYIGRGKKESAGALTVNGVHLTSEGNRLVSGEICRQWLGGVADVTEERLEAVRQAVLDKNFHWFNCYRTTDGFSIFGDRGELQFVDGQTNREVLTRELEILAAMADRRDPVIWAAANGRVAEPDDSGLPAAIPVKTNIPGELPEGKHTFLPPDEAMTRMKLPPGFEVSLFASEEDFPEVVNPVQMAFDTRGRLWVAVWPTYPHWKPGTPMNDKLLVLEDTDGNGRADRCTTFAEGLHNPTGFEFWGGGVFVASQPNLLFLADTDGDDRADLTRKVLHGIDSADTHHAINSFVFGPDGALYFQEGTFHHTQIETPRGVIRSANAGSYRFEPKTWRLSVYTAYPYANPHGHVFDGWGTDILHDGTSSNPYDAAMISGHLDFPAKHASAPAIYPPRTRPCPATELVSSGNFPESMHGELLVENVIGDLGILRYRLRDDGAGMSAEEQEPLLLSSDPRFRPVDLEFAPDGSLYFIDWHNPIIGHMQHNLRDPNRDRAHGRVYRIRHQNAVIENPVVEAGLATDALVAHLVDPATSNRAAYRARIELSARKDGDVAAALGAAIAASEEKPPSAARDRERLMLLWLAQQIHQVRPELVEELRASGDHRVRCAVMRVIADQVDRLPSAAEWLLAGAVDSHPRVRMLAVRGASFLGGLPALEVIAAAAGLPRDRHLDYVIGESMRVVPASWKKDIVQSGLLQRISAESQEFLLQKLSPAELLPVPVSAANAGFFAMAPGISLAQRGAAVRELTDGGKSTVAAVLVERIGRAAANPETRTVAGELGMMLGMQPAEELAAVRPRLEEFTATSNAPGLQRAGWLGMVLADAGIDKAWQLAESDPARLAALAGTLELLPDSSLQAVLFDRLNAWLADHRKTPGPASSEQPPARFVRIELPGKNRTLTLAEVEVLTGDRNVARNGVATQSSTSHGGEASRAIDGNISGVYGDGGQTHSEERSENPWWELSLPEAVPVHAIRIHNRTEDDFFRRMDGFTVQVLAADRSPVFERKNVAASREVVTIPVQAVDPARMLLRAALEGLSQARIREREGFQTLAAAFVEGVETEVAARGLMRIRVEGWDAALAPELVRFVLARLEQIPAEEREGELAGRLFQVGQQAAALLPEASRKEAMLQINSRSVPVLNVGTRPHRMEYDRTLIAAEPGRRLVIVLENTDMMPHNLVLVRPGKLESVGLMAELESTSPEALRRNFVPVSSDVLAATPLVQPGESVRLSVVAPAQPGVYPFVCTYPGHWRRMYGALYVVPSVEEFMAGPEKYAETNGLRIEDPLLRLNASRREWKPEDFAEDFSGANAASVLVGRNFERGRELFRAASCSSCHRMAGEGFQLGPDLAELDKKWTDQDLLGHILVPSSKIDDKYRSQILLLASGNTVSGIVTEENERELKLTDNPLQPTAQRTIARDEIDDRSISDISMMPVGLLDTLSHSDILDLLAYVRAVGDPASELYQQNRQR